MSEPIYFNTNKLIRANIKNSELSANLPEDVRLVIYDSAVIRHKFQMTVL